MADIRRKILAGAAVLEEAEQRPEYEAALLYLLDRFLTRPADRALFNLPTQLPDRPDKTTSGRIDGGAEARSLAHPDTRSELKPLDRVSRLD